MMLVEAILGVIGAVITTTVPLVVNAISKLNSRIRALESAADKQEVINNQIVSDLKDLEVKVEKLQVSISEMGRMLERVLTILESKDGKHE